VEDAALAARASAAGRSSSDIRWAVCSRSGSRLDLVEAAALITPAPAAGITVMTWQLAS
jgi:hypothetical protein